jgi:uncharacterized protein YbjT (DUF2867 family)
VASRLLDAGKPVRVIVRDKGKGQPWLARGAEVAVASVEDADALAAALSGATGAYLMVPPPGPEVQGILARGRRITKAYVEALQRSPVRYGALLSSIGAQHPGGTGPIVMLHHAEQELQRLPTVFSFIRAAYFMENLGALLGAVTGAGVLPTFFDPSKAIAMVATQDIGETAAAALLNPPAATEAVELAGPRDYSFADAAAAFAQLLGKPVQPVAVPREGIVPSLTQAGLGAEMAGLYREMSEGIDNGLVDFSGAGRLVRGKVPLEAVLGQLLGHAQAA